MGAWFSSNEKSLAQSRNREIETLLRCDNVKTLRTVKILLLGMVGRGYRIASNKWTVRAQISGHAGDPLKNKRTCPFYFSLPGILISFNYYLCQCCPTSGLGTTCGPKQNLCGPRELEEEKIMPLVPQGEE